MPLVSRKKAKSSDKTSMLYVTRRDLNGFEKSSQLLSCIKMYVTVYLNQVTFTYSLGRASISSEKGAKNNGRKTNGSPEGCGQTE